MTTQEMITKMQCEMAMLIEHNQSLLAQQKQMGEFLSNFKIIVEQLQRENITLLNENQQLKGIGFENVPLQPVGPHRGTAYGNPSDDEDEDDDTDTTDDDAEEEVFGSKTCWGCQENQPNQFAHMDKGGCLYYANTDSEDEGDIATNTLMDEMDLGANNDSADEVD